MIWLEANTERSESNPGRSLGIITSSKKELSGRQYHDLNKHPCQSVESVFVSPLRVFFEHGFIGFNSKFAEECDAVA